MSPRLHVMFVYYSLWGQQAFLKVAGYMKGTLSCFGQIFESRQSNCTLYIGRGGTQGLLKTFSTRTVDYFSFPLNLI